MVQGRDLQQPAMFADLIWKVEVHMAVTHLNVAVQGADPFGFRLSEGQSSFIGFCAGPPAFACPGHWHSDLTTLEAKVLPHDILYKTLTTLTLSAYPGHTPHHSPASDPFSNVPYVR